MNVNSIATKPFDDQRPGTAGLRRKVAVFAQPNYLENYLQAVFDTVPELRGGILVAGGDGRYFNREALAILVRVAAGNGVRRLIIGQGGILSTPAASHLIRERGAQGGFLLTASHNPGGPDGDFGVKFNVASGGQAPEAMTDAIHAATKTLSRYLLADVAVPDLDRPGESAAGDTTVEIVDPVSDYAQLMERLFDFDRIHALVTGDFRFCFDAMHAVTGPYAREIFVNRLGAPESSVANATPLPDFGGGHPDPNPVDAAHLVAMMAAGDAPDFAAASDGDGDRNMILGRGFAVSPGDSLAVIAAHAGDVPGYRDGLAGVARSMPTSRAVDRVAERLGIPCYQTPTGWRFFCNLLEAGRADLCGEESFGTSSSHTREKDGLWAVLFWLNLLAVSGRSVEALVREHWAEYGRNAFRRHDYFVPDTDRAAAVMEGLAGSLDSLPGRQIGSHRISAAENFRYEDPVDGSVSENQGIEITLADGSRMIYRLSGTGTSGATLRVYLDRLVDGTDANLPVDGAAVGDLGEAAHDLADITKTTGLTGPTGVI
jgi:phosphoglucomutase